MIMPGRLKLAKRGEKAVLYYEDDECWMWAKYQWWNPAHWFKRKKKQR